MDRRYVKRGIVALVSLCIAGAVTPAGASSPATNAHPSSRRPLDGTPFAAPHVTTHRLVVDFGERVAAATVRDEVGDLSQVAGVAVRYVRATSDGSFVVELPGTADAAAVARQLENAGAVANAEPDYIAVPMATPNDPGFAQQWHYGSSSTYGIGLPTAWDTTKGSANVVVAVLDTGIRPHQDFGTGASARIITDGDYDMITDPTSSNDGNGRDTDATDMGDYCAATPSSRSSWHGTHVAGTIGAATNNGTGVAGIDWRAKILPVRVLGCGGGSFTDIAAGIRYAAGFPVAGLPTNPHPADVINMSLGGYTGNGCGAIMQNAINDATAAGAIVVVAAGNDGDLADGYSPASCNNVISVGATNRSGLASYYSNFGPKLDVSAPGGETDVLASGGVLSTLNDGDTTPGNDDVYAWYSGTSMAAPHVAGVVSLLLSLKANLTTAGAEAILAATAHHFAAGNDCAVLDCGAGIVDAGAAVKRLKSDLLHVTAANGGEHWKRGTTHAITWAATTPSSNVKIELLRTGMPTVTLKTEVLSSAHTWSWKISPGLAISQQSKIRVTRTRPGGIVISDTSNANFSITP